MANDIWAGVNFGDSIMNPGSVAQTYTPSTGQTTYGTNKAIDAVAANSAKYAAAGVVAPNVATPTNTPSGAPVYQGAGLGFAGSNPSTNFAENPVAPGYGLSSPYASNPNAFPNIKSTAPITPSTTKVAEPKIFDAAMAKEYALSKGDSNYQQYIGGTDGQANPNYIGPTAFKKLQSQYTPYQIEQATVRTKDGIYWNPEINISKVSAVAPSDSINKFSADVLKAVADGKAKTDVTDPKAGTTAPETAADKTATASDLSADSKDMNTAVGIFNSIMNTPGMDEMKKDVQEKKNKLDEYDQQMDELTDDIRKEVEGEAPESYINALAAVRGNSIMKLRRAAERDYNTAVSNFNAEKELKTNQINMMVNDANNRYNRAFQTLQFEETKAQNEKSYEAVKLNAMLTIPEGKSYTFADGTKVEGLKENDNIQTGTFTDASNNIYYYAIDKKTGKEAFPKVYIGKAKATGGTASTPTSIYNDYKSTEALNQLKAIDAGLKDGTLAKDFDQNGDPFYYDKKGYEAALAESEKKNNDWIPFNNVTAPTKYDYQKY